MVAPSRSRQLLLSVVLLSTLGAGAALAQPATFSDVPEGHWAFPYVEALAAAGFTTGCAPGLYCPDQVVLRQEVAVFLVRATKGPDFVPTPLYFGIGDMSYKHWAVSWVEHSLYTGDPESTYLMLPCSTELLFFCPEDPMTRAEMAEHLLLAKYRKDLFVPAVTTSRFEDVPVDSWQAPWVELLATDGITAGCTPTRFCPNDLVTRAEMAVFLVRTFNLPIPLGEL
jgi:S-layer homology domain